MSEGVVLTRGDTTLDLRKRAHLCPNWEQLLAAPPKRGRNRVVPGATGTKVRPRVSGEVRAIMPIEIYGAWNVDGTAHTVNVRANTYTLLDTVQAFLDSDVVCTISITRLGSLAAVTGTLQIEDPGPPMWVAGDIVRLEVDVTVPAGRLVPA